jgi:hypothetical protein
MAALAHPRSYRPGSIQLPRKRRRASGTPWATWLGYRRRFVLVGVLRYQRPESLRYANPVPMIWRNWLPHLMICFSRRSL